MILFGKVFEVFDHFTEIFFLCLLNLFVCENVAVTPKYAKFLLGGTF